MNKGNMYYVHILIGLAIMFAFRFIPVGVLPEVTEVGMQILGIFLGTIYLWTTIDPTVSSLISISMLAYSDYAAAGAVLASWFGNPVVVQMMFLMIFTGGLTNRKLTLYIGRWIMTRKFVEGRPWVFTAILCFGTYVMSAFIGCFAPIFLFWPVLYGVFDEVGYKREDEYPKQMLMAIVLSSMCGFPVPPWMANGLALLSNFRGIVGNFPAIADATINNGNYFMFTFTMGAILTLSVVLVMKYIFRPNVEPLKKVTIEMLNKNPLPPMDKAQRIYSVALVVFICMMLFPSLLPTLPVLRFINANSYVTCTVLCLILVALKDDNGKPILDFASVMEKDFSWPTFWLCGVAILIGSVLTNEKTGVTPFLNVMLSPIFNGMSGMMFTVVLLVMTVILTNTCNSLVVGMILQPVILTYCAGNGVNPGPIISIMIFTVLLTAACTPAASPFAAMLFGNERIGAANVYKRTLVWVAVELILILVVGVPLVNLIV